MTGHFSTAYLPPVHWWGQALACDILVLEKCEQWQKQSYRNRCYILGANGPLMLNIPVQHPVGGKRIDEVQISYRENWRHRHWQAILSAYGSAPFFEALAPELEVFYQRQYTLLWEWNLDLIHLMEDWLQLRLPLRFSESWQAEVPEDFRDRLHPKKIPTGPQPAPYPQVLAAPDAFVPRLSAIDLLFNEGPAASSYLLECARQVG